MTEKKRRTPKQLKKEIMDYFKKQTFPRTTGQIADAVGLNWYSTTNYLMELKSESKLFHEKCGRQNQWWIVHVGNTTKEVKKLRKESKEIERLKEENKKLREEIERLKGSKS